MYLSIGVCGILLALSGRYQGGWLTLVRMMFLLPCYGAGTLYKEKLEARDRADNGLYLGIILAAWLLLAMSGRPLIYSVAFCNGFLQESCCPMSRLHWESRSGSGYPASWPEHLGTAGISGILAVIHMR